MATAPAAKVMQHIRKLAAGEERSHQPDRQLLERFVVRQDDSAFGALVRRHGPVVLGVCRRVLRHEQDAEDVFQATFLVLARKAGSIGKKDSLGGWLYKVAYHAAIKARAQAATRLKNEKSVRGPAPRDPLDDLTGRELLAVLDEEMQRLPERFRVALVHCYLGGQTRNQAARQLGWSLSTLQRRLEQGRERLRGRLERRGGVALSIGLLVAGVTQGASASAPPPVLIGSTVKAAMLAGAGKTVAAGAISAPALALANDVLKSMFTGKLKIATAFLAAVGLIGVGVGTATQQILAQREAATTPSTHRESSIRPSPVSFAVAPPAPAKKESSPTPPPPPSNKETVTITGRVVDANGKAVPGADVAIVGRAKSPLRGSHQGALPPNIFGQGKADTEGQFHLNVPRTSKEGFWDIVLLAHAAGYALGWQPINVDADQSETEVRLSQEEILRGRLVDLQGQPAVGAEVRLTWISLPPAEGKSPLLLRSLAPPDGLACWPSPAMTDAQGRFALHGLASKWTVTLDVQHERFARYELVINPEDKGKGDEITRALAPARIVEGDVTYADTGKPVPNAGLQIQTAPEVYDRSSRHSQKSQANEKGRFRVIPHAGNYLTFTAYPPVGEPYLPVWKNLTWPKAGGIKQELHLVLRRGILVRGTVSDVSSGNPVAGARVDFEANHDNNPYSRGFYNDRSDVSGPDGKFQLVVLPGPGHLIINGPTLDYVHTEITTKKLYGSDISPNRRNYPDALVALNLKPQTGAHEVTASLRRGVTLTGRVVGPDGKAVESAVMLCRSYIPYGYEHNVVPSKEVRDGKFELPGCDPERPVQVFFFDAKNRLGALVALNGAQLAKPVTVQLQRCVTAKARFVDAKGRAVANVRPGLELVITPGVSLWVDSRSKEPIADIAFMSSLDRGGYDDLRSDEQGRVTLPSLIPGATYWLTGQHFVNTPTISLHKEFKAQAGQALDLGDILAKRAD